MADRKKSVPENVPGDFFVDTTCIDCDTCRQLAPACFADSGDYSYVFSQPKTSEERREATRALLACPTGSIGCDGENLAKTVMNDFPILLEESVFYCGFNSPKSYGGNSYFVEDRKGNWLVDCPKFANHLVNKFEKKGGIAYIFLTHEDDVADANHYAEYFNAKCIIHEAALKVCSSAEIIIDGFSEKEFYRNPQFTIIPTPGHTKGHMVLLYKDKYLFTGDHLAYSRDEKHLEAFRDYCWYSWPEQTKSMKKLLKFDFEWILPGHGSRIKLGKQEAKRQLEQLVKDMAAA